MKAAICLALVLAMAAAPALAQQQQPQTQNATSKAAQSKPAKKAAAANNGASDLLGSHNSNAPINVSSDNFVGELASKVGTDRKSVV